MPPLPRSLPRVCIALGFPSASELSATAEREYKDGNTFFEVRLDRLSSPTEGISFIRDFRTAHPDAVLLATCRHKDNGGGFRGSVSEQVAVLLQAVEAGAALVDLEIESAAPNPGLAERLRRAVPLIVSYHNFESTPALDPILRKLQKVPADMYKVATTARKPSDNLRLLRFAREHRQDALVTVAMSESGLPSRVLGPSAGSRFTFASPADSDGTASGQIPAKTLRGLYRAERLSKASRVYGVVADPVRHSKSPLIHNRAFQARRLDAVYLPFLVAPVNLGDWMKTAVELPVSGFSVTIPHKQKILRYLDVVDPLAKRIGAVNTVWRKAGKWRGANTDTQGVVKPLSRHIRLAHASVLIVGYGGAARAAAITLTDAGASVTITGRNPRGAEALARVIKSEALSLKKAQEGHYDVLVHATPLGMWPKTDETPFEGNVPADIVLDMVYNPVETRLLREAAQQGRKTIPGTEMLLEQAICQFEIWTGESAPRAVMQKALDSATQS